MTRAPSFFSKEMILWKQYQQTLCISHWWLMQSVLVYVADVVSHQQKTQVSCYNYGFLKHYGIRQKPITPHDEIRFWHDKGGRTKSVPSLQEHRFYQTLQSTFLFPNHQRSDHHSICPLLDMCYQQWLYFAARPKELQSSKKIKYIRLDGSFRINYQESTNSLG